jgi:hypothetical protein
MVVTVAVPVEFKVPPESNVTAAVPVTLTALPVNIGDTSG